MTWLAEMLPVFMSQMVSGINRSGGHPLAPAAH